MSISMIILGVLAGGAAGYVIKLPAGVLVGGLVGGIIVKALLSGPAKELPVLSIVSQLMVALVIVLQSDTVSLRALPRMVPLAFFYSLCLVAFSLIFALVLEKFFGVDALTALFSAAPGALSGMGIASADVGANAPLVLAVHVVRVVTILVTVPLIAGWWVAR